MDMGRRAIRIVLLIAAGIVTVAVFAVAPVSIHDRLAFGTFDMSGAPPHVDYCGRRYYPQGMNYSSAGVAAFLAQVGEEGLTRIGMAPSGMPIVANVASPATQAGYHTNVCTMGLWVQTGSDTYVGYVLSGGP